MCAFWTSTGKAPNDWVALTTKMIFLFLHHFPTSTMSCLKPVEYLTWLVTSIFVFAVACLSMSERVYAPSFGFMKETPYFRWSQGMVDEGNSSSIVSTFPFPFSISATRFMPWEVFRENQISRGSAFRKRATFALVSSVRSSHFSQ